MTESLTRKRSAERKRAVGFTLPEVLATVAIVSVLAAVVIPTIAGQIQKSDPAKVGNDAMNIRGAVEQFLADVRRYPANISHLTNAITGKSGPTLGAYASAEVARWRGPYLSKDSVKARQTGWGFTFDSTFAVDTLGVSSLSEATATNPRYLVLAVAMDSTRATQVDQMFDDGTLTTGLFRWTVGISGSTDTLKFLLVPIQ